MRSFAIEEPGSPVPAVYATLHHTKTRDGHHGMDWIRYNDLPEQKLYCKTLSKAQLTLALSTLTRLSAFYTISNLFGGGGFRIIDFFQKDLTFPQAHLKYFSFLWTSKKKICPVHP